MSKDHAVNLDQFEFTSTPSQTVGLIDHLLSPVKSDGTPKPIATAFVWGPMGIGKTDIVRQLAKKWGRRMVALHLPQFDPTDIKGIPIREEDGTVAWVPTSYLPRQSMLKITNDTVSGENTYALSPTDMKFAEDMELKLFDADGKMVAHVNNGATKDIMGPLLSMKFNPESKVLTLVSMCVDLNDYTAQIMDKAIIFLDELSAADPSTQNAALQLCQDRRVNEYEVPDGVAILAAGNRESDGAFVQQLSAPLGNRFCHIKMVPNVKDFIQYGISVNAHPAILGWVESISKVFDFSVDEMSEGNCGFMTPRSLIKLSEQFDPNLDDHTLNCLVTGYIGKRNGMDFIAQLGNYIKLPKPEDILSGKVKKLPNDLPSDMKFTMSIRLCYHMKEFHAEHFNSMKKNDPSGQSKKWNDAVENFLAFIADELGLELATRSLLALVGPGLDVPMVDLRSSGLEKFSNKYGEIFKAALGPS